MLFTLWTSNPFLRLIPAAQDGADLNPVLQDFALSIHPPMLYTGLRRIFGGLRLCLRGHAGRKARSNLGKMDPAVDHLRVAVSDHRHCAGSWWAYYELGWGGWWFWDPVEMPPSCPWLVGTALIHSLSVTEKRGISRAGHCCSPFLRFP